MSLHWRTITRPNGEVGHRETMIGLQSVVAWLALLVTIVGGMLADRVHLEHRLDETSANQMQDRDDFLREIRLAIVDADKDVVRDHHFEEWGLELNRRLDERDTRLQKRLDRLESASAHTLGVVEKLPK